MASVIHCRLAWSPKKRRPRNTASEVAAASEIVVVGTSNHVSDTGDGVDDALHVPLKLKGNDEVLEDEELVVVGKGKVPLPGRDAEDTDDDPVPVAEFEVLNSVVEELVLGLVPVLRMELLELIGPVWLEPVPVVEMGLVEAIEPVLSVVEVRGPVAEELVLTVPVAVFELEIDPEVAELDVFGPTMVELAVLTVLDVLMRDPVELAIPDINVVLAVLDVLVKDPVELPMPDVNVLLPEINVLFLDTLVVACPLACVTKTLGIKNKKVVR